MLPETRSRVSATAAKEEQYVDENVLDYCGLDAKVRRQLVLKPLPWLATFAYYMPLTLVPVSKGGRPKSKRTLGEKEQDFLEALRVRRPDCVAVFSGVAPRTPSDTELSGPCSHSTTTGHQV